MSVNLLSKIPLFAGLPLQELDGLAASLDARELDDHETLFHEGDPGEHFYVVLSGALEVLMGADTPEELLLNVLSEGEYFGEMSLITPGGHRTATVRARGGATLLSMSRAQFLALTKKHPELAISMVRVLSQRLDATNTATFRDLTEKNRQLQQAYDELKAAQAQIIEKEILERELQVAADIQLSILPDVLPHFDEFGFGARILPARQVGGDLYDVFPLKGERVGVLIGDVADKGVPSALFMARTHALIMAEADIGLSPGEVLRLTNSHITRLQKSTQFVTVLYGILDLTNRQFSYARAGHEPPLLLHANGTVERLPHGPGMALGLWDSITLDERTVEFLPGDSLLLYTDGMTDCRSPKGEPFGLERIKRTLGGMANFNAQQICDRLLATLQEYQNGSKQDDDVTLVAVNATGDESTAPPKK
jgi:sigma-B regulation protein RsbU (phosphoserine phosphatase)